MEMKKNKDDSEVVDDADHGPPVRLYKINTKDSKIARLTTNHDWIERFALSPDGQICGGFAREELALCV